MKISKVYRAHDKERTPPAAWFLQRIARSRGAVFQAHAAEFTSRPRENLIIISVRERVKRKRKAFVLNCIRVCFFFTTEIFSEINEEKKMWVT